MKQDRIHLLLAALFSLVPLIFHFWAYLGHYGFDDMRYAELAHNLTTGEIDPSHNFFFRFFPIVLTAASYQLFGISDFTSALPAMLVTGGTIWLMFPVLRKQHLIVALLAYTLFAGSSMVIQFADKLSADPFVTFAYMLAALALYLQYTAKTAHAMRNAFLLALAVFLGACAKETVLFMFPWLAALFMWDLVKRSGRVRFWLVSIGWGLLFGVLYLGIVTLLTGDPLIRFQAALEGQYLSFCSYHEQPFHVVLERITIGMPAMFVQHGLVLVLAAAALGAVGLFSGRRSEQDRFFGIHVFLLLLVANFLSVTPSGYSPLCLDPRHFLFLVPLTALSLAPVIYRIINGHRDWRYFLLLVVLIAGAGWAWQRDFDSFGTVAIPLLAWMALAGIWPHRRYWMKAVLTIAFVAAYGYNLFDYSLYVRSVHYPRLRTFLQNEVLERGEPMTVYTDRVQARLGRYYKGFSSDSTVVFHEFEDLEKVPVHGPKSRWILYNGYTVYLAGMTWEKVPAIVKYALAHHEPVAGTNGAALFDIETFPPLVPVDTTRFKPCGAGVADPCVIGPAQSSDSLVLGIPVSKNTNVSAALVLIDVTLELKTDYRIEPELHFSQSRDSTVQHHVAYPLFSFVRSFGIWSTAQVQQYYLSEDLAPGDSIRIWLGNPADSDYLVRNVRVVRSYLPREDGPEKLE